MKIKPISKSMKPLLNAFLTKPELQSTFERVAKKLGYNGSDPDKVRVALFTPNQDSEICFASNEIYELFTDFHILKTLSETEPFKTIIINNPETIPDLIVASKIALANDNKEDDTIQFNDSLQSN